MSRPWSRAVALERLPPMVVKTALEAVLYLPSAAEGRTLPDCGEVDQGLRRRRTTMGGAIPT
jgi:hypothetical protein